MLQNEDVNVDDQVAASSLPTPVSIGDEIVLRTLDVSDKDIKEWVKQGYAVAKGGDTLILQFTGTSNAAGTLSESPKQEVGSAEFVPSDVTLVDAEVAEDVEFNADSEPDPNFKGQGEVAPIVWSSTKTVKIEKIIPDTNQELIAEVLFRCACDRSASEHIVLRLEMLQAVFGVLKCKNDRNHRGHFVYLLEVTASPSHKWRSKVSSCKSEPADDSSPEVFVHQDSRSLGVTLGTAATSPVQLTANNSVTISSSRRTFKWTSKVDLKTRSVTWMWRLESWKDGQPFRIRKLKWGPFPELPVNPEGVQLNHIGSDAEWRVCLTELEDAAEVEWDIAIHLHTVSLDQIEFSLRGNVFGYLRPARRSQGSFTKPVKIQQTLNLPVP